MASISLNNHQKLSAPLYSADKSASSLPSSLWQKVLHFLSPKECAHTLHTACTSWKDIMPDHGYLDLSGLSIRGTDLARIIEANGAIHSLNLADCTHITDDDLACLSKLSLKNLSLDRCDKITDKGLAYLAHLPLRALSLNECRRITDKGLIFLQELPLNILDLGSCINITDQGIAHFKNMFFTLLNLSSCIRITDEGMKHLLHNNSIERLFFCFSLTSERLLSNAIESDDIELVRKLLACKVAPEPSDLARLAPLYIATSKGNVRVVELLLQAGADPNRCPFKGGKTPYELALSSKNLLLAAAFSTHSLPHLKPKSCTDIAQVILGLHKSGAKLPKLDPERIIAEGLPSLCPLSQLRALSPYVSSDFRHGATEALIDPLLHPLSSVQPFIAPLQGFAARETCDDPHFAVYITPPSQTSEEDIGGYSHLDGTIDLYVKNQEIRKDRPAVLLHELSHKACDKLGWNDPKNRMQKAQFAADVAKDIEALKRDRWVHCHKAVARMLKYVEEDYAPNKQFEEYLVRMPEILTLMAQETPKPSRQRIEKRIQKDLPHLYSIYTKKFLPQLEEYNRTYAF